MHESPCNNNVFVQSMEDIHPGQYGLNALKCVVVETKHAQERAPIQSLHMAEPNVLQMWDMMCGPVMITHVQVSGPEVNLNTPRVYLYAL